MSNTTNSRRTRPAMSLVEVLVGVSIVAIMAAVATVNITGAITSARLQHAVDRLSSDFNRVRDHAMTQQQSYSVLFNTAACSYTAPGVPSIKDQQDISVCLGNPQYSITAITINGSNPITFDRRGLLVDPTEVTLQSGSRETTIRVGDNQAGHEHF